MIFLSHHAATDPISIDGATSLGSPCDPKVGAEFVSCLIAVTLETANRTHRLIDVFMQDGVLCTSLIEGSLESDSGDAWVVLWIDVLWGGLFRVHFL